MELKFGPKGTLLINDARIVFKNFAGREDKYNREGDRNFSLVIPTEEMANMLMNDVNAEGAPWNVKIKPPRDEDDTPFMRLPVKIKYNNGRGPKVYLNTGRRTIELKEDELHRLDRIDIASVDMDIRPYDNVVNGKPYRTAYLQAIWVVQEVDRFTDRLAEEEYPE